jgi:hypothetical protein
MTYELDRAKEELIQAIDKLNESAMDDAKDQLLNDSKKLADFLFKEAPCGWMVDVIGLEWPERTGFDPLTVVVCDPEGDGVLYEYDPIDFVIGHYCPRQGGEISPGAVDPPDKEEADAINRAIHALRNGIDRLKAHAAFRGIEVG